MHEQYTNPTPADTSVAPRVASELNNLIQIISGTSELIENIWEGTEGSEKYFAMLRASILRAEQVTAQLVAQASGANDKVILHPDLQKLAELAIPAPSPPQPLCILVVDDEQMVLSLFRRVLTGGGYEVVCAQSGMMEAGLSGYLRKPLRNDEILCLVASIIQRAKATQSIRSGDGIAAAVQDA